MGHPTRQRDRWLRRGSTCRCAWAGSMGSTAAAFCDSGSGGEEATNHASLSTKDGKRIGFARIRIRISRITIFVFPSNFHLLEWKRIGFARIRIQISRIFSDIHFPVSLPFPSLLSTVSTYSTSRVFFTAFCLFYTGKWNRFLLKY